MLVSDLIDKVKKLEEMDEVGADESFDLEDDDITAEVNDDTDESFGTTNEYTEVANDCVSLSEDGLCLDGCSCSNVEIEQACPFINDGYETCCCYEPIPEEDDHDYGDDDDD